MSVKLDELRAQLINKMVSKHCKIIFRQKEGFVENYDGKVFTIKFDDGTIIKPIFDLVNSTNNFYFFNTYKTTDTEIDDMQKAYTDMIETEKQEEIRKAKAAEEERIAKEEAEKERIKKEEEDRIKALNGPRELDEFPKARLNKAIEEISTISLFDDWITDSECDALDLICKYADENVKEALFAMPDVYKMINRRGDRRLGQYKKKAFEFYKQSADEGDAFSQYRTGYMYENAFGVKKDLSMAIHYYDLGQAQGNDEAICSLAWLYYMGRGVPKDEDKAMALYRRVFSEEELEKYKDKKGEIQYKVCEKFDSGRLEESLAWTKKADLAGSDEAKCDNAIKHCNVRMMRKLAKKNHPNALFCMAGLQGEFSQFVREDEARSWLEIYKSVFPEEDGEKWDNVFKSNYGLD